jgi:CheY-like chemotaxis protein
LKILLVDDDKDYLLGVSELFSLLGLKVQTATSGNEAWSLLLQNDFDLVVTDIRMTNGSGIELLINCKSRNVYVPKVLLVSGFQDYSLSELYNLGVDGFFEKPFDLNAIRKAIKLHNMPKENLFRQPDTPLISTQHLLITSPLLNKLESGCIQFGRMGFFYKMETHLPKLNEIVSFTFKDTPISKSIELSGFGTVVWSRENSAIHEIKGIGVHILSIEENIRVEYINWIEKQNLRPLIPIGKVLKETVPK